MLTRRALVALFGLGCVMCARPKSAIAPALPRLEPSWNYVVEMPPASPTTLNVEAHFVGAGTKTIAFAGDFDAIHDMRLRSGQSAIDLPKVGEGWRVDACARDCTLTYTLDLRAAADRCDDLDCGIRYGDAVLAPLPSWLVRPSPTGDPIAHLQVKASDPNLFLTGITNEPTRGSDGALRYTFHGGDIDEGSLTSFGPTRRLHVDGVGGAQIDVALLGSPMALSDDDIAKWIGDANRCVAQVYGRFPVDHASIFVLPIPHHDGVVFGKVVALTGASVVLLVGDRMPARETHLDWVAVHELFHLGFPSFRGEGRWLDEGLATYFEPILRTRAGWISESELWRQFVHQMPRGVAGIEGGLIRTGGIDATYWGGALFALLVDLRIREQSGGAHSFDDVLRAVLTREGNATHVWSVADVIRVGDDATGTNALHDAYARYVEKGEKLDLDALFASLGIVVETSGHIRFDENAKLAQIRHALVAH